MGLLAASIRGLKCGKPESSGRYVLICRGKGLKYRKDWGFLMMNSNLSTMAEKRINLIRALINFLTLIGMVSEMAVLALMA